MNARWMIRKRRAPRSGSWGLDVTQALRWCLYLDDNYIRSFRTWREVVEHIDKCVRKFGSAS